MNSEITNEKEEYSSIDENSEKEALLIEDVERISKVISDEVVLEEEIVEEKEEKGKIPEEIKTEITLLDVMQAIDSLRNKMKNVFEKLDVLVHTVNALADSLNEIKNIVLFLTHPRKSMRIDIKEEKEEKKDSLDKLLQSIEDLLFSPTENEIVRAIMVESALIDLENILQKINEGKITISSDKLEKAKRLLNELSEEAMVIRQRIIGEKS